MASFREAVNSKLGDRWNYLLTGSFNSSCTGAGSFEIIFTITVAILIARYMYGILSHLSLKSPKTKKVNLPLLALSSDADSKNGKTDSSTSWEPISGDLTNS